MGESDGAHIWGGVMVPIYGRGSDGAHIWGGVMVPIYGGE